MQMLDAQPQEESRLFPERRRLDAKSMLPTVVMGASVACVLVLLDMSVQGHSQLTLPLGHFTQALWCDKRELPDLCVLLQSDAAGTCKC